LRDVHVYTGKELRKEPPMLARTVCAVALTAICLSACGTTPGDRALSGGLLGAGTGAAIGAAAGNPAAGALIGGLGGATIGALTSPNDVNLGPPPWRTARARSARYAYNWEAYCSSRYRSFDPASGTYLGYD